MKSSIFRLNWFKSDWLAINVFAGPLCILGLTLLVGFAGCNKKEEKTVLNSQQIEPDTLQYDDDQLINCFWSASPDDILGVCFTPNAPGHLVELHYIFCSGTGNPDNIVLKGAIWLLDTDCQQTMILNKIQTGTPISFNMNANKTYQDKSNAQNLYQAVVDLHSNPLDIGTSSFFAGWREDSIAQSREITLAFDNTQPSVHEKNYIYFYHNNFLGIFDQGDFAIRAIIQPYKSDTTIKVIVPNGGENWSVASSQEIKWSYENTSNSVRIDYSVNNGVSWINIISNTPGDGSYIWTIPNTPSESCLVRITDVAGSPSDISDSTFTIYRPAIDTTGLRVELTWQGDNCDLDLIIVEYDSLKRDTSVVCWVNPCHISGGDTVAYLDVDDNDGYGPENYLRDRWSPNNLLAISVLVHFYHTEGPNTTRARVRLFKPGIAQPIRIIGWHPMSVRKLWEALTFDPDNLQGTIGWFHPDTTSFRLCLQKQKE